MPWPERIYEGLYRTSANSDKKERIPRFYSTQMQVMINALNRMPLTDKELTGSKGFSVLMANSLMFQRFPTHNGYEDPQLANFYGQALPLLKRGVPVKTVHIENLGYKEALAGTKVLLMTYANMKPLEPEAHSHIADWVKKGGVLIYSGTDNDPFQNVREWWNTNGYNYATPSAHLLSRWGFLPGRIRENTVTVRELYVLSVPILKIMSCMRVVTNIFVSCGPDVRAERESGKAGVQNNFYLQRGDYDLAAVLEESVSDEPFTVEGCLIDLFDPQLPIYTSKQINPGEQALLLNVERVAGKKKPQVLASASREEQEECGKGWYSYVAKSPAETSNVSRVLLPSCPKSVTVDGKEVFDTKRWHAASHTYLIEFENNPDGVSVKFCW